MVNSYRCDSVNCYQVQSTQESQCLPLSRAMTGYILYVYTRTYNQLLAFFCTCLMFSYTISVSSFSFILLLLVLFFPFVFYVRKRYTRTHFYTNVLHGSIFTSIYFVLSYFFERRLTGCLNSSMCTSAK